jgi:peptidoglycan/xylan/chitin deacetylase (PgdA/CDA1 family)
MFHHFHSDGHPPGQGSINAENFERIVGMLGAERMLTPAAWLERLDAGALKAGDLCLTFDDGLLSQYEVALPVMDRLGLKAFWFVYSSVFEGGIGRFEVYRAFRDRCFPSVDDFYVRFFEVVRSAAGIDVDRAVTDAQVAAVRNDYPFYSIPDVQFRLLRDRVLGPAGFDEMMDALMIEQQVTIAELAKNLWMAPAHLRSLAASGHHVGLHSYSHPMVFADLSYEQQRDEYERNYAHLREVCRSAPAAVAHPVNSYSQTTLEILDALGIQCGFRANMAPRRPGDPINASALEFAREDHANIINQVNAREDDSE